MESPRRLRRAGARPLPSAPGASASRLPRRAGARPLPSAPGASAPRLPRRAGARPLLTECGARVPRYRRGPELTRPSHQWDRVPDLRHTGRARQPYRRHRDRSPTAPASGPCPTDSNQGLVVTFQVTGRTKPQQSDPSQAASRPSVASHMGHRIPAGGGRCQGSYLSRRPIEPVLTVIVVRSGRTSLIRNNRAEG